MKAALSVGLQKMRTAAAGMREAVLPSSPPPWIRIAQREIGVRERRGGENLRILEYHSTTTLKASEDEIAWCSSFMNWVMQQCGMERTHSAAARSWLGCGTDTHGFRKYAIVVMKRGSSTWQGHVCFAIEDLGANIRVLGGNQSNEVCYAVMSKANVLGYRWPVQLKDHPAKP